MSQIQLKPKNPKHEVFAGLDRPLDTFFMSVFVKQEPDDMTDIPPVEFKHKWSRSEVVEKLYEYCVPCDRLEKVVKCISLDIDPIEYVNEPLPKDDR